VAEVVSFPVSFSTPLKRYARDFFIYGTTLTTGTQGLAYARTDIGGAYKLNADDSWTPLLDFADDARWNYWGVDALATDPVQPNRLYVVRSATYSSYGFEVYEF
jgi:xyloglucan-specific exo-beta-1,4-glucanase